MQRSRQLGKPRRKELQESNQPHTGQRHSKYQGPEKTHTAGWKKITGDSQFSAELCLKRKEKSNSTLKKSD